MNTLSTGLTGDTAASDSTPDRPTVAAQFNQLERELNFVYQAVQDLEGRMAPLLSPEVASEKTAKERARPASVSPLGEQILVATDYAEYIANRIRSISSRL